MKIWILLIVVLINFNAVLCGDHSKCEVEGVDDYYWRYGVNSKVIVEDVHDGLVVTYRTENILEIAKQTSRYLQATFENETIFIYTNEKFKDFEKEYTNTDIITIEITFNCIENTSETLKIKQKIKDTNNNDPVLSQDVYEYHFGMPLPADYDLTKFLQISASDIDFSNRYMYFTLGYSQDVVVGYHGDSDYDYDHYYTSFKTLKEIKGPFKQEYTLTAIDGGEPKRNTTSRLILVVSSDRSNENGEISPHPPVFAQNLYFANYTSSHLLKLENDITIKYGAENDTTITQSGFQQYFQVTLREPKKNGRIQVNILQPLPMHIMKTTQLLVIEIEAENKDFPHMPGRTALIIRLPSYNQENSSNSQNCNVNHSINFQHSNNVVLVILFASLVITVVIVNAVVLVWYFRRRQIPYSSFNNDIHAPVQEVNTEQSPTSRITY